MMFKSPVAAALCLALIGVGVPTRSSASPAALVATEVPAEVYVEIGEELYHVDLTSFLTNRSDVMGGSGSFTISVKRAVVAGREIGAGFAVGQLPSLDDVRVLGPDIERAAFANGTELWNVRAWSDLIAWTMTTTPHETRASYVVGQDRLSMTLPRSVVDAIPFPEDRLEVELNEFVVSLEPLRYVLPPLADRFVDGGAFVSSYIRLELILERIFSNQAEQPSCVGVCMSCAASGIMSVASFLAIAGSCTAAVATAGAMTPLCAAALLAHIGANITAISFCGLCVECLNPGPPGGGGGGGGAEDPSGSCPPGYHECCSNQCCSDVNPPSGCDNQV
jgi:hypothetical protein